MKKLYDWFCYRCYKNDNPIMAGITIACCILMMIFPNIGLIPVLAAGVILIILVATVFNSRGEKSRRAAVDDVKKFVKTEPSYKQLFDLVLGSFEDDNREEKTVELRILLDECMQYELGLKKLSSIEKFFDSLEEEKKKRLHDYEVSRHDLNNRRDWLEYHLERAKGALQFLPEIPVERKFDLNK